MKITKKLITEMIRKEINSALLKEGASDNISKSYINFVAKNLKYKDLLLDLWGDMVSGASLKGIVATAEERLGYKRDKSPFASMPVVGSKEHYLFGILSGIKFHARKVKSGGEYPTREQIDNAVEEIVGKARQRSQDRQTTRGKEQARVAALSPEEREEEKRQRDAEFGRKMSRGDYGSLD